MRQWIVFTLLVLVSALVKAEGTYPPTWVSSPSLDADGTFAVDWQVISGIGEEYTLYVKKTGQTGYFATYPDLTTINEPRFNHTDQVPFTVSGFPDGEYTFTVMHCYWWRDVLRQGCSAISTANSVTLVAQTPAKPSSVTSPATISVASIPVSWSAASGANHYIAQYSRNGGGYIALYSGSNRSATKNTSSDGTYKFRVKACEKYGNSSTCSGWKYSGNTIRALAPSSPSSISVPDTSQNGSVTVTWGASTGSVDRYELFKKTSGSWGSSPIYSGTSRSFSPPNLSDGTYAFRVRAKNTESTYSSYSGYRTSSNLVVARKPVVAFHSLPQDNSFYDGNILVKWSTTSGSASSYNLQMKAEGARCSDPSGECSSSWTDWQNISATSLTEYFEQGALPRMRQFRVQGCNIAGCGNWEESPLLSVSWLENIDDVATIETNSVPVRRSGRASINQKGEASYAIPFSVPKAPNGSEPILGLDYTSGRSLQLFEQQLIDDYIGYGWSLSGMSSINRCTRNTENSIIQLNDSDGLCLDGEPLIRISGTHFSSGAKYRKREDDYTRIELLETGEFLVEFPNGSQAIYGGGSNGATVYVSDSQGTSPQLQWSISERSDSFGNRSVYFYHMDSALGINYPVKVLYGKNLDAEVIFQYTVREDYDVDEHVIGRFYRNQKVLLNRVLFKQDNISVREYRLIPEATSQGWTRLKYIQECGFNTAGSPDQCSNPFSIGWMNNGDTYPNSYKTAVESIVDPFGKEVRFGYTVVEESRDDGKFDELVFGQEYPVMQGARALSTNNENPRKRVASSLSKSNGLGGYFVVNYDYLTEGYYNTYDRRFVGFPAVRETNAQTGVVTYRKYHLEEPYEGRLIEERTYDANFGTNPDLLGHVTYEYEKLSTRSGHEEPYYSYIKRNVSLNVEQGIALSAVESTVTPVLNGSGYPDTESVVDKYAQSVSISAEPTNWANPVGVTVSNYVRAKKKVTNYTNKTGADSWLIGLVSEETVTTYDGDTTVSPETEVMSSYTYWDNTSAIQQYQQMPGDPDLALTVDFTYDSHGNMLSDTTAGVDVPTRTHSVVAITDGRVPSGLSNPLGHETTIYYDKRHWRPSQTTNANLQSQAFIYDTFGREVSRTTIDGVTYTTDYTSCTLVTCEGAANAVLRVRIDSPVSPVEDVYLDVLGRIVKRSIESLSGSQRVHHDTLYNERGLLEGQSLPYFASSTPSFSEYEYDVLGRKISVLKADGANKSVDYSVIGNEVRRRTTEYIFTDSGELKDTQISDIFVDAVGDIVRAIDGVDSSDQVYTKYEYDGAGRLVNSFLNDDTNSSTSYGYDELGNRTSLSGPNIGTVSNTYTADGRMRTQTDAKSQTITYHYDLLGRIDKITNPDGVADWSYDGQLKGAVDEVSYIEGGSQYKDVYSYLNKRIEKVDTQITAGDFNNIYTTQYTYDSYGRLKTRKLPTDLTVRHDYNGRGYLYRLVDQDSNLTMKTISAVDAFGNARSEIYGNGLTTNRIVSGLNGLVTDISTNKGGQYIQNEGFSWLSNGMLERRVSSHPLSSTSQAREEEYTYDSLNRLKEAEASVGGLAKRQVSTQYDLLGNLKSKTSNVSSDLQVTNYAYDRINGAGKHGLTSAVVDGENVVFHYDANGAITRYENAVNDDKWIDWSGRQLPAKVTVGISSTTSNPVARDSFLYGPTGKRYYRKSEWLSGAAKKIDNTFYALGYTDTRPGNDPEYQRVERVQVDSNIVHIRRTAHTGIVTKDIEYQHRDHQGSVVAITDQSGAVVVHLANDPFGARRNADWAAGLGEAEIETLLTDLGISVSRGYTDHEHLDRTGLIHMNGRIYDPSLGRFISPDPIVQAPLYSQSWNRYAYVFNGPTTYTDPSGYRCIDSKNEQKGTLCNLEDESDNGSIEEVTVTASRPKKSGGFSSNFSVNWDTGYHVWAQYGGSTYNITDPRGWLLYEAAKQRGGKLAENNEKVVITKNKNSILYERDGASVLVRNDVIGGDIPLVNDDRVSHALDISAQEGNLRVVIISGYRGPLHKNASENHEKYNAIDIYIDGYDSTQTAKAMYESGHFHRVAGYPNTNLQTAHGDDRIAMKGGCFVYWMGPGC